MSVDTRGGETINVVGLGLIGGSLALALKALGYRVVGSDVDSSNVVVAREMGAIDAPGCDSNAFLSFVCTPPDQTTEAIKRLLDSCEGIVTDVGSVKGQICDAIDDPRFVGGHPMAGSELDGLDGADAAMFDGAVWVLTPTESTADTTFSAVATVVRSLRASVVAMKPDKHDEIVAVVSHMPHLLAATLMSVATGRAAEDLGLLRLAAGGFRDMTRIASGRTTIWLDICRQNRPAIVETLNDLLDSLRSVIRAVDAGDDEQLRELLEKSRRSRLELPVLGLSTGDLVELRIPIPDRPGTAAEVFTLAGDLAVNIFDFEIVHSIEGGRGVVIALVAHDQSELFRGALLARGFRPVVKALE